VEAYTFFFPRSFNLLAYILEARTVLDIPGERPRRQDEGEAEMTKIVRATETKVEILEQAFHRNGSNGNPFNVYLVKDEEGDIKVVVAFEGTENTAVLSVAQLAEGDIAFGSNSWRGTEYRRAVEAAK
jgi:hypothetical protein